MRRSLEKAFPVKNQEWSIAAFVLARRQFLRPADVKDIFDHMQIMMNRLFSNHIKEKTKQLLEKMNMLREIGLQI